MSDLSQYKSLSTSVADCEKDLLDDQYGDGTYAVFVMFDKQGMTTHYMLVKAPYKINRPKEEEWQNSGVEFVKKDGKVEKHGAPITPNLFDSSLNRL